MEKTIQTALHGKNGNHLFPFIWVNGSETEEALREEVQAVYHSGIRAFIVEGRPYEEFVKESWWKTLRILLDEAKKHDMKVWILDDAHFPSGYANGAIVKDHPELSKQYFEMNCMEVCGPMKQALIDTTSILNRPEMTPPQMMFWGGNEERPDLPMDDFIVSVVAVKNEGLGQLGEIIDLTDKIRDGILIFEVPDGLWKIYTTFVSRRNGGSPIRVNMADRKSCELQVAYVYEEHLKHVGDEFGKTLVGFFGDEAEIGNSFGYDFDDRLGQGPKAIPYSEELCEKMEERMGKDWKTYLPMLYFDFKDEVKTVEMRYAYMDILTQLVSDNFVTAISEWCEKHNLVYTSHILEDNNSHSRMGCSMGHYFRALDGQHFAGIDDIGNQVVVGGADAYRENGVAPGDGEFYHYTLGKLGPSHAHIDAKKSGNTVCEIYGCYGWGEGTRLMKYLADHFMVRGTNNFIYHGFSAKYPAPDIAPQLYCKGEYPLYRKLGWLNHYINRVCDIFSDGTHRCDVGILYHGESDWVGETMMMQKPARVLMENQIDFDFLPNDIFKENNQYHAIYEDGMIKAGTGRYKALIICECDYLPVDTARFIARRQNAFPVYFLNRLPKGIVGGSREENQNIFEKLKKTRVIPLERLSDILRKDGLADIEATGMTKELRFMHYSKETELYMFSNEASGRDYEGVITVSGEGIPIIYDAYHNCIHTIPYNREGNKCSFPLKLHPYNSVILSMEKEIPEEATPLTEQSIVIQEITGPFRISFAKPLEYPAFHDPEQIEELENIAVTHPKFSGIIRYETSFELMDAINTAWINLPEVYELAEIWVNDVNLGTKIFPPYTYPCDNILRKGTNRIVIETTNTWINEKASEDHFSRGTVIQPTGLLVNPQIMR